MNNAPRSSLRNLSPSNSHGVPLTQMMGANLGITVCHICLPATGQGQGQRRAHCAQYAAACHLGTLLGSVFLTAWLLDRMQPRKS